MSEDDPGEPENGGEARAASAFVSRRLRIGAAVVAGLLVLALTVLWFTREEIAGNVIASQLDTLGLPATYEIESIGPRRQVLRNVVVGDPRRPDLTVERMVVSVRPGWGGVRYGRIALLRPRLYGSYRDGKLSFGSLDPLIFRKTGEPPRLPNLDLAIVDGRGRLDSDFGPLGLKVDGAGRLRGGFAGVLAAVAPRFAVSGCSGEGASFYGRVRVRGERPSFAGPLRLAALSCPAQALTLARSALAVDATVDKRLDGVEGKLGLTGGALAVAGNSYQQASGSARFAWRKGALTAHYDLKGEGVATPQLALGALEARGVLRILDGLARVELEADLEGLEARPGPGLTETLARIERAGAATLAAPLAAQLRRGLLREAPGSRLSGGLMLRQTGEIINLVVPQANLRGGSGESLVTVSRLQLTAGGAVTPRLSGNFATGGAGLPRITGRMERRAGGALAARLTMAEYRAGEAAVALPELLLVQDAGGALGFAGQARLSGPLPGGGVRDLVLPLDGNWSPRTGLALWRRCTVLRAEALTYAQLRLQRQSVTLCPPSSGAIVRLGAGGARIAGGAPSLAFAGTLGSTPIRVASGPVGFSWPGTMAATRLDVALGPPATASRFRIADLTAKFGSDVTGRFVKSDIVLNAAPLDLRDATGTFRYFGGRLTVAGASFRLTDRRAEPRFEPLVSRDGALALANNVITGAATLREPRTHREVVRATLRHELTTGRGHADLAVQGLTFDRALQPATLSRLALGVIANTRGTIRGTGRVDWTPKGPTSSGRFSTDNLDFAAAFGPVRGASGTIVFSDLLGMVTAPGQRLRVASINPGIEVTDGEILFALRPGRVLQVEGGSWPFLGGRLSLEPVALRLGESEERRYVLLIEGLDAARFVEKMQMANITATGTFDGRVPLVFGPSGGRVEGGLLAARAPGGRVSYIGTLTYKDLSPMANLAFEALKSVEYRALTIAMDGALEGEIVTRVRMSEVRQGPGARRNFITERIGKLPIQFNINVRAPFYQLITSYRSFNDPAFVRDPRELGLLDAQGNPRRQQSVNPPLPSVGPGDIQPPASENKP